MVKRKNELMSYLSGNCGKRLLTLALCTCSVTDRVIGQSQQTQLFQTNLKVMLHQFVVVYNA